MLVYNYLSTVNTLYGLLQSYSPPKNTYINVHLFLICDFKVILVFAAKISTSLAEMSTSVFKSESIAADYPQLSHNNKNEF